MQDIISYSIRIFLVFLFIYLGTRILTKKSISEMSAYEVAGLMILSNVAAEPLVNKILVKTIFGIGSIILLIFLAARLALINRLTPILEHTPTLVIKNGKIDMSALKGLELSINELMGALRQNGYDKVSDIEYAIMEPQGQISVFPKSQNRPLQVKDLNIQTKPSELTLPVIMDGEIIEGNLKHVKLDKEWLLNQLKMFGIKDYKAEVTLAELDSVGKLQIIKK